MKNFFNLTGLLILFLIVFISCSKENLNEVESLGQSGILDTETYLNRSSDKPKKFVVVFKKEQIPNSFSNLLMQDEKILNTMSQVGMLVVESSDPNFIDRAMSNKEVQSTFLDFQMGYIDEPMEKFESNNLGSGELLYELGYLWGLDAIEVQEAWDAGYTGSGVRVAVLDSGIDPNHVDLDDNLNTDLSTSFIAGEGYATTLDAFNHGTHVAGTIGAEDDDDGFMIGVAPNVELVAVKVLSELSGSGPFSSINQGVLYAADIESDVINMSLGAVLNKDGWVMIDEDSVRFSPALIQEIIHAQQRVLNYAHRKGSTIITSAGNNAINADGNRSGIILPADLNNVITVSASAVAKDDNGNDAYNYIAGYTNYGKSLIDVLAPGGSFNTEYISTHRGFIVSCGPFNSYYFAQGTSMAAPHVAGIAALIIEKNGGQMHPHEVRKTLQKSTSILKTSPYAGWGLVNAANAVE